MSHSAPTSRLRRALLLGTAAALLAPAAASAAPGDLTPLADNAAAVKVSGDGAWAAYSALGGNGKRQIFVRNLATGVVTPVTNGNLDSDTSSAANGLGLDISVDGRYVVFDSSATDLVPGLVDGNGADDVFRWDRVTATTQLVSAGPDGGTVAGASRQPHISGDGRFVVFQSVSKLTPIDPGANVPQVYVRNQDAQTTTMASVTPSLAAASPFAERSDISADGRFVSFVSDATNLVAGDTNAARDVFRYEIATGLTIRVSLNDADAEILNTSSDNAAINGDGTKIVFESDGAFDPADLDLTKDMFVRDLTAGTTRLASITGQAIPDASDARGRDISADGTRVPFDNGGVFVRDLVSNSALPVSADATATFSAIDGAGTFAGFLLGATHAGRVFELPAGNDVTAPALTFAASRVSVAADPSGIAKVVIGGNVERLDAVLSAGVADGAVVEVWDGSGNHSTATAPTTRTPPPSPPPPTLEATGVKVALQAVKVAGRKRMQVTLRFTLSAAATARLEIRTVATKTRKARVVRIGKNVARKPGARSIALTIAPTPGRYTAKLVLSSKAGAKAQAEAGFRIR